MLQRVVRPKTRDEMLAEFPIEHPLALDWYFRWREASNHHYVVEGSNPVGRLVSREGSDVEELLSQCASDAHEISQRTPD